MIPVAFWKFALFSEIALITQYISLYFICRSGFDPAGPKNVLLVTDGLSNMGKELTLFKAFNLKDDGVEIFVVAVGGFSFGMQEILGLASSTDRHLYRVLDMESFVQVANLIPSLQ